jgi:hypothetical protein
MATQIATLRHRADGRGDGDAARFARALADHVRETLSREQILEAIAERLEATAGEAVHRALHARLSPALYELLRSGRDTSGIRTATDLLDEPLADAIEQQVIDALRNRITDVLRERLDPALGAAIARSGEDVTLDAGAELALELRRGVQLGICERLRDGLRSTIRARLRDSARDRVAETVRFAATEAHAGNGQSGDRFAAATATVVETAVHDSVASGIGDRIRVIVANSMYEALGARLDEGLRTPWRAVRRAVAAHDDGRQSSPPRIANGSKPDDELFAEHVRPYIAEAVRDVLSTALRERLDTAARRAIEDTLRDRLVAAIHSAAADQRRWNGIDLGRFGDAVRRQLCDALRTRLLEALRGETTELLRNQLEAAVQLGIARGARES